MGHARNWICCGTFFCVLVSLLTGRLFAAEAPSRALPNSLVFFDEDTFAGWPANEGSWAWGDEVLVCFNIAPYEEKTQTHSLPSGCRPGAAFARSLDGGRTWVLEPDNNLPGGNPTPCPGVEDMTAAGFALKLRGSVFYLSQDKGRTWQGPYALPDFGQADTRPNARTSYIVTGPKSALCFITTRGERAGGGEGERGRSYVMRTQDGCKTFEFLGWMSPDLAAQATPKELEKPVFSIMPSVVRTGENDYVAALRQRIDRKKWTDVYASRDGGKTWEFLSRAESGSNNPPALVQLPDGRLALLYGWRGKSPGVRAKLSADGGKTWQVECVLRDDARTWDIGYPRAHVLPDGTVLVTYYYTTASQRQQHIEATRWTPRAAQSAPEKP